MKIINNVVLALLVAATVATTGCATSREVGKIERRAEPFVLDRHRAITTPQKNDKTFVVENSFYAARKPIQTTPVNPGVKLPEMFFKKTSMNIQTPTSLTEIASRIAKLSSYQVSIDQDVLAGGGSSQSAAPVVISPVGDASSPPTGLPPLPGSVPSVIPSFSPVPSVSGDLVLNEIIFSGNLSGLLDSVAGKLGLSWRWTGSRIELFRYETKMFRLNSLAGDIDTSSNIDTTSSSLEGGGGASGGGGGGTSGSSGSSTSVSSQMQVWSDVEKAVQAILTSGGKVTMTPSAGLITVRDTPQTLRQVESQISEFNRIYGRQVMLNVEIYAIERAGSDSAAIDWNLVWNAASSQYGFGLATGGAAANSSNAFILDVRNGPFTGSGVAASVVSTLGNSTQLASIPVTTLNGLPVPFNVSRDQAYVASYSTTLNGSDSGIGGSTTTITPGVVSEGVSMSITPRILEDNNVLIRYAIDLSTIEGIQEFVSPDGSSAIQLPRRAVRNFLQNVNVKSGQTLVLTGFQQVTGSREDSGPGSPKAWFLGGKKSSILSSRTLVIVITPFVLE